MWKIVIVRGGVRRERAFASLAAAAGAAAAIGADLMTDGGDMRLLSPEGRTLVSWVVLPRRAAS